MTLPSPEERERYATMADGQALLAEGDREIAATLTSARTELGRRLRDKRLAIIEAEASDWRTIASLLRSSLVPLSETMKGAVEGGRRFIERGHFTLHSGEASPFRFNVEALTDDDLAAAAGWLAEKLPAFGSVYGIPRGGVRLARALSRHATPGGPRLVVDDVLTTGRSMEGERKNGDIGAVLIARGPCPPWITPLLLLANRPSPPESAVESKPTPVSEGLEMKGADGVGGSFDWPLAMRNLVWELERSEHRAEDVTFRAGVLWAMNVVRERVAAYRNEARQTRPSEIADEGRSGPPEYTRGRVEILRGEFAISRQQGSPSRGPYLTEDDFAVVDDALRLLSFLDQDARPLPHEDAEREIHGLCPGHPIAAHPASTCAHCNLSRSTLERLAMLESTGRVEWAESVARRIYREQRERDIADHRERVRDDVADRAGGLAECCWCHLGAEIVPHDQPTPESALKGHPTSPQETTR